MIVRGRREDRAMNRPSGHPERDRALTAGAKVTIRAMTAADVDAAARLATQLGYPSTPEEVLRRFHAIASLPENHVIVAASEAGTVVGWIHVFGNRLLESEPDAEQKCQEPETPELGSDRSPTARQPGT